MRALKYTQSHEWICLIEDDIAEVGISEHAQEQLGDVVFVELPNVGDTVAQGDEVAVIESVKAASSIYTPIAGEIVTINEALADAPETINSDATGNGWLYRIRIEDSAALDALMNEDAYTAHIEAE